MIERVPDSPDPKRDSDESADVAALDVDRENSRVAVLQPEDAPTEVVIEAEPGPEGPAGAREAPTGAQEAPTGAQEAPKSAPDEKSELGESAEAAAGAAEGAAAAPEEPSVLPFVPRLDSYAGPLDLLLYLIHKNEVDILDIPIARILDQYLAHLHALEAAGLLELESAGEFLVFAGRLMEIKSRLILPAEPDEEDELLEEELIDPRRSLVEEILEYKQAKERAEMLEDAFELQARRYDRPGSEIPPPPPDTLDLSTKTPFDLIAAFQRVLSEAERRERVGVIALDDEPMEVVWARIEDRLGRTPDASVRFEKLFDPERGTRAVIVTFLAILEMAKEGRISLEISDDAETIDVRLREEQEDDERAADPLDGARTPATSPDAEMAQNTENPPEDAVSGDDAPPQPDAASESPANSDS